MHGVGRRRRGPHSDRTSGALVDGLVIPAVLERCVREGPGVRHHRDLRRHAEGRPSRARSLILKLHVEGEPEVVDPLDVLGGGRQPSAAVSRERLQGAVPQPVVVLEVVAAEVPRLRVEGLGAEDGHRRRGVVADLPDRDAAILLIDAPVDLGPAAGEHPADVGRDDVEETAGTLVDPLIAQVPAVPVDKHILGARDAPPPTPRGVRREEVVGAGDDGQNRHPDALQVVDGVDDGREPPDLVVREIEDPLVLKGEHDGHDAADVLGELLPRAVAVQHQGDGDDAGHAVVDRGGHVDGRGPLAVAGEDEPVDLPARAELVRVRHDGVHGTHYHLREGHLDGPLRVARVVGKPAPGPGLQVVLVVRGQAVVA
mmetsp:Transcript_105059/g.279544  ORF Transcript_105059/g.279544 Transcript_105059/m.279544 type:complete len:370 (+) Transcript_105059:106-1215(+)